MRYLMMGLAVFNGVVSALCMTAGLHLFAVSNAGMAVCVLYWVRTMDEITAIQEEIRSGQ